MDLEDQILCDSRKNDVKFFKQISQQYKFCMNSSQDFSSIPSEHLAQDFFDISNTLKPKLKTDEMVKETFALSDEEESYFQYFKNTLDRFGQVYIMCLD